MATPDGAEDLRGIPRIFRALVNSVDGLIAAFRHEEGFRLEVLAVAVLTPVGLWLAADGVERALLVGVLLLVPLTELINSAVEAAVDRIGEERHELSGRAKDLGSAAVFVAILLAAVTWLLVLGGRWLA